jgi:hypothetical protein
MRTTRKTKTASKPARPLNLARLQLFLTLFVEPAAVASDRRVLR